MSKTSKKKDDKKNKKQKRKQGASVEAAKLLKSVLKAYDQLCTKQETSMCVSVRNALRANIEEDKLLHKFIFNPNDRREVVIKTDEELTDDLFAIFRGEKEPPPPTKSQLNRAKIEAEKEKKPLCRLKPFLEVLRSHRYVHIQTLLVYDMHVDHDDIMTLANMCGKGPYQFEKIELLDCFISAYSITRFAPFAASSRTLVEIILDNNEFGDEGCRGLCEGLQKTRYLLTLSLCYCNLTHVSGVTLGKLVSETPIRSLFLDGNLLEAEGLICILDNLIVAADVEKKERDAEVVRKQEEKERKLTAEKLAARGGGSVGGLTDASEGVEKEGEKKKKSAGSGKKRGKRRGRRGGDRGPTPPPPSGPQIEKLHVADNGIDHMGRGGNFAPIRCMQLIKILISCSKFVEEIDLWGNDIGDLGSQQVLEGLLLRKEEKLPQMGLTVSHRINPDTFDKISKLAPGIKKKRGGKKKKK